MNDAAKSAKGFAAGSLIGALGGLIGLGGAEFRLPVLVGVFGVDTLRAVILNKAISLVVVAAALLFRLKTVPMDLLWSHVDVVINLLLGSLVGAWWAAGHAMTMSRLWLNRIILVLLVGLAFVMLSEGVVHTQNSAPLIAQMSLRFAAGLLAGLVIGMVAALLGVAGGELLIPTIVILFGLDVKVAGSLSLCVSLPTMLMGFVRYRQSNAFEVLKTEHDLLKSMALGSVIGAALGSLALGMVPTHMLTVGLGVILLISAVKTFSHIRHD